MIELRVSDENVQKFLNDIKTNLKKHKFKLVLSLEDLKIGKNSVSGWFDESDKELAISIKDSEWLSVLVHEYCHFLQHIENDSTILALEYGDENHLSDVWDWLDGKFEFFSKQDKNMAFNKVIQMELNCERRAVEKIKEYKLPIDLDDYISSAHIYLYYYLFAKKHKKWFGENFGSSDIKLFEEIPNKTLEHSFKTLPRNYEELFKKFA